MIVAASMALLLNVTDPMLQKAEALYVSGRIEEAVPLYQRVSEARSKALLREQAIASIRLYLIQAPYLHSRGRVPSPISAARWNALLDDDRKELQDQIYGVLRWAVILRQKQWKNELAKYLLSGKLTALNRVRIWYLLAVDFAADNDVEQARWHFMKALKAGEGRTGPRIAEIVDLVHLNLSRLSRFEEDPERALYWARFVSSTSPWIFHASHESMWAQFQGKHTEAALATATSLMPLMDSHPSLDGMAAGTREVALNATLLGGFIYLQRNDLLKARETYLLALESLRVIRDGARDADAHPRSLASVGQSLINPFRYPGVREQEFREWLPAKDYSELTDVYDDSIRVMKQLVDLSQLLNGARAETLKAEQRKLTEEVYHIKSRELGRMLSFLGLKAQLGMSHVAWQDRANRMAQKRNLLMVREKMTNLAQDRMNEIKN